MFESHPAFYYFTARKFFHAAHRLEEVANLGDKIWQEEIKKLELVPWGPPAQSPETNALSLAQDDRKCRDISAYLFAHALELALKSLCLQNGIERKAIFKTHKISELIKLLEGKLIQFPEISNSDSEISRLIFKLDEALIWAGRYPEPRENGHRKTAIATISYTDLGNTDDLVIALSNGVKNPLKLLKDFCLHVLQQTANDNQNINHAKKTEAVI